MVNDDRVYNYNQTEPTEQDPLRQTIGENEEDIPLTFREKIADFVANITLEPSLMLFIISLMISSTTTQNLKLEKACRVNLNFSTEICDSLRAQDIDNENEYERETQRLLSIALIWRTYLSAILPCLVALFVGSFSDKTGHRKFFIVIAVTGQFLVAVNNVVNVVFFYQLSLEVLVLSGSIIEGLSGGMSTTVITAFAFISAITTDKNRTFRMGLMSFSVTVAFPIGTALSGVLLQQIGYYGCYAVIGSLHILNLLYLVFVLRDPKRSVEQKQHDKKGCCHLVRTFFDFTNVKATIAVLVKNSPKTRRLRLCILLAVVSVLFGPVYGEMNVLYMFTRFKFGWDEVQFSIFQTYNFITNVIGTLFSLMVFTKYLQWHDSMLGIVSTVSKIAGSFVFCFAPNGKLFYIGPLVEILNGTSMLSIRSIITKLVEPDELGKVNSLIGLVENLMPLVYVPLYTTVYSATMEVLPGAVFLLGAAMTVPAVIVLVWLFYDHRKNLRKSPKTIEELNN